MKTIDIDALANRLADRSTPSTAHMSRGERQAGVAQMLADLQMLAKADGCVAAAWAVEMIWQLTDVPAGLEEAIKALRGNKDAFRAILADSTGLMRRVCRNAQIVAERKRVPPWSIIGEITGHGSGVSSAIYQLYGDS